MMSEIKFSLRRVDVATSAEVVLKEHGKQIMSFRIRSEAGARWTTTFLPIRFVTTIVGSTVMRSFSGF